MVQPNSRIEPISPEEILIVEDDRKTAALLSAYLEREGFRTRIARDGPTAVQLVRTAPPVLIVLDIVLPGFDGWEICRQVRSFSDVPILILSARQGEEERVLGLSLGADDYVVKPFSPKELVERVKAILRRTQRAPHGNEVVLSYCDLTLDVARRRARLKGKPLRLTPSEYNLLRTLMSSRGRVFTRDELLASLYPAGEQVVDRVIDVHVGNLRRKIEQDPSKPHYILTERGIGYLFTEGTEDSGDV